MNKLIIIMNVIHLLQVYNIQKYEFNILVFFNLFRQNSMEFNIHRICIQLYMCHLLLSAIT